MLFFYVKMAVLYENVINLIVFAQCHFLDLNSRPLDYKSDALSTELLGQTSEITQNNKKLN